MFDPLNYINTMPFLPRVLTLGDEKALEQFVLPVPCVESPVSPL